MLPVTSSSFSICWGQVSQKEEVLLAGGARSREELPGEEEAARPKYSQRKSWKFSDDLECLRSSPNGLGTLFS